MNSFDVPLYFYLNKKLKFETLAGSGDELYNVDSNAAY
jgi:hypothetical protein